MAPPAGTLRVGRYFLVLLAILAVLYAIVFWPGQRHTPKLGLDLIGGTQVIFTAETQNGGQPSSSSMKQAEQIMTDRVNGTGVTEATVVIQGTNQLVVSIPGANATDVKKLGAAAKLNFRGVVAPAVPVTCTTGKHGPTTGSSSAPSSTPPVSRPSGAAGKGYFESPAGAKPSGSATPGAPTNQSQHAKHGKHAKQSKQTSTGPSTGPSTGIPTPKPFPTATTPAKPVKCSAHSVKRSARKDGYTVPLDDTAYQKLGQTKQAALAAALADFNCASAQSEKDLKNRYFVACATGDQVGGTNPKQQYAVLLGPVIVSGDQIANASAVAPGQSGTGGSLSWTVSLNLKNSGQTSWANYTSNHNIGGSSNTAGGIAAIPGVSSGCGTTTPCADYVAFTLDGNIVSAPVNEEPINGGATQISGNFNATTANALANQLKYGALPLSFTTQDISAVSATLGSSQLKSGLLAGGIGLVLVVLYSLIYYRALGLVTIASLVVSGGLTYACLVMLATQIGFTLSLAGIAGFIVAIGITADSFVVFFERMKDEVHEGRSAKVAVPRAWVRARRTILSADTVSFLAAAILYYFAAGDVRGFAFTLGLSTILDLIVVFLFTHPVVSLLSRLPSFGSARFTGLSAVRGGPAVTETPAPDSTARQLAAAERARARRAPGAATASTVVLDKPGRDEPLTDTDVVPDGTPPGLGAPDEASPPRRRTVAEPGSAAERAAARRAKLRDQKRTGGPS